jgi:hypothetical protein
VDAQVNSPQARIIRGLRRTDTENLHDWFMKQLAKLPGRSPTADAIRYAMRHWHGLVRFLEDGRIELDTNPIA